MEILLNKLGISVEHLKCLDEVFRNNSSLYNEIEAKIKKEVGSDNLLEISRELYAGGKKKGSFNRQMILGDIIEYIFTGRAYYYAAKSRTNFSKFAKLVLYCIDQLLLFDTITISPEIRKKYLEALEKTIDSDILYEKENDKVLADELKKSDIVIWNDNWKKYDLFVDSILPKTLGCPKELVVFLELIRLNKGLVVPLLLTQRLFGAKEVIVPPDFLFLKRNREIFGIEVGYKKESQSREFSLMTSIPTFAVDLINHMHNRCPKCGENILYCDIVIKDYAVGKVWSRLDEEGRFKCLKNKCPNFDNGKCPFAIYYGKYKGKCFYGKQESGHDKKYKHYHAKCVLDQSYEYRGRRIRISDHHINNFFAQVPGIEGLEHI